MFFGVHSLCFATQCNLHFDKHQKSKFFAYIYIRFNQSLDEKSYKRAKSEAVKQQHAVFLLLAEQRRRPIKLNRAMDYFYVADVAWVDVDIGMYHIFRYDGLL